MQTDGGCGRETVLPRVLVVDPDAAQAGPVVRLLRRRGFDAESAAGSRAALSALSERFFDVAVVDVGPRDDAGEEVMGVLSRLPEPPAIILLAPRADGLPPRGSTHGPVEVVEKPVTAAVLVERIVRVIETATIRRRLSALDESNRVSRAVVLASDTMKRVFDLAERVARTPATSAIILGESGAGKEAVATHIHDLSARASGPFVRVNLAAIPDSMIEGELFGSVRGSYTGSHRDRIGYFASADGGTLLLDEVGEFKVEHQPKLLRALEERRFFPIGSDRERRVNVRVLAATNREPSEMILDGRLREDLYYRLGTVVIRVPPLRERTSEIVPLAEHFLDHYCKVFRRRRLELTGAAQKKLLNHAWPGNVRELKNVLERAVMTALRDEIAADDLTFGARPSPSGRYGAAATAGVDVTRSSSVSGEFDLGSPTPGGASDMADLNLEAARERAIADFERAHIAGVLRLAGGSRRKAAELLGVSRSTLYEKLNKYGLHSRRVG